MTEQLLEIFQDEFSLLCPRSPVPEFVIAFYAFANVNHTIRLREGRLLVRLSDLLQGAPEPVLRAIAHILIAKVYRKSIERGHANRYRRYVSSHDFVARARVVRQVRGRKRIGPAQGFIYNLDEIFDQLNLRFFHGLMARPQMAWSAQRARRTLGHYDPAHHAIVVSRIFDHPQVPRCALDYIVYHEMLHLRHPVRLRGSRRCVHPAEFQAEERRFPQLAEARAFLRRL